jgi:hypothetical protein
MTKQCKLVLPLTAFYIDRAMRDGHIDYCRKCSYYIRYPGRPRLVLTPIPYPRWRKYDPELIRKALHRAVRVWSPAGARGRTQRTLL